MPPLLFSGEKFGGFKRFAYLCSGLLNKPRIDMETTTKRTREEVRAAFRAYMREKEEERKAAEIRLELYHQKRLAGRV